MRITSACRRQSLQVRPHSTHRDDAQHWSPCCCNLRYPLRRTARPPETSCRAAEHDTADPVNNTITKSRLRCCLGPFISADSVLSVCSSLLKCMAHPSHCGNLAAAGPLTKDIVSILAAPWPRSECQHVATSSADQHVHEPTSSLKGSRWKLPSMYPVQRTLLTVTGL
jgi:hypothetical protein